jgi:hypothetical protein
MANSHTNSRRKLSLINFLVVYSNALPTEMAIEAQLIGRYSLTQRRWTLWNLCGDNNNRAEITTNLMIDCESRE